MPHIHTNAGDHDHTASAYIIRVDEKGENPRMVLHRHKKLNVYLQFGGHIEIQETPWQALVHELREETGYDISQLKIVQPINTITSLTNAVAHPTPICHNTHAFDDQASHFHSDIGYLLVTSEEPTHEPDDGESSDILLLSQEEILKLSENEVFANIKEIALFCFSVLKENSGWTLVDTSLFE